MGFLNIHLQCADGDLHVRITRKGKALISRGKPSLESAPPAPPHDRRKEYPFPPDEPDEFLETIGVMREGRVLQPMREKFRQVNHFLALLSHTELVRRPQGGPLRLMDCGCGRAFLTLAAYHYLREKRGMSVQLAGVDADAEVIARASELRDRLGYEEVQFARSRILEYEPPERPQAVFSLHACDTATDEAIAQGVKWQADLILCAPCCQHELHHQVARPEFRAALRHGILRERVADILTDALRAAALRVMGYRTERHRIRLVRRHAEEPHDPGGEVLRRRSARRGGRVPRAARFLGREALHRGVARKRVAGTAGVKERHGQGVHRAHSRRNLKP